jgi:hypothetical protein
MQQPADVLQQDNYLKPGSGFHLSGNWYIIKDAGLSLLTRRVEKVRIARFTQCAFKLFYLFYDRFLKRLHHLMTKPSQKEEVG